jgi:hypothetical protein
LIFIIASLFVLGGIDYATPTLSTSVSFFINTSFLGLRVFDKDGNGTMSAAGLLIVFLDGSVEITYFRPNHSLTTD